MIMGPLRWIHRYLFDETYVICGLAFLGFSMSSLANSVGVYNRLCLNKFDHKTCRHLSQAHSDEDEIQSDAAAFRSLLSVAYFLPGIFSGLFLGAWGDKYGRKPVLLLGTLGLVFSNFGLLLVTGSQHIPLCTLYITSVLGGLTGDFGSVILTGVATLTDSTLAEGLLTTRITVFQLTTYIGGAIGSAAGGGLAAVMSLSSLVCISLGIYLVSMVYAVLRLPEGRPWEVRQSSVQRELSRLVRSGETVSEELEKAAAEAAERVNEEKAKTEERTSGLIQEALQLEMAAVRTYLRQREGWRRACLLLSCTAYLINVVVEGGVLTVLSLYVLKSPFSWGPVLLGLYSAWSTVGSVVMASVALGVLDRWLGLGDVVLVALGFAAKTVSLTGLGLATTTWEVFAWALVGGVSLLSQPGLKSLSAKLVDKEELGRVFSVFGLTLNIGVVGGALAFAPIYRASLHIFPGLVFLIAAGLCAIAGVAMIPVYFALKNSP